MLNILSIIYGSFNSYIVVFHITIKLVKYVIYDKYLIANSKVNIWLSLFIILKSFEYFRYQNKYGVRKLLSISNEKYTQVERNHDRIKRFCNRIAKETRQAYCIVNILTQRFTERNSYSNEYYLCTDKGTEKYKI